MTINENDRLELREAFIRVFADQRVADIAMEAMPPIDYTSFARTNDVDALGLRMDARFSSVDSRFDAVDARFDRMESRFDAIDHRFGAMDAKFEAMNLKFGAMEATFSARFEAMDVKFGAMEARFGAFQLAVEGMIDSKLAAQMRLMFLMQLGTIAAVTVIIQASV